MQYDIVTRFIRENLNGNGSSVQIDTSMPKRVFDPLVRKTIENLKKLKFTPQMTVDWLEQEDYFPYTEDIFSLSQAFQQTGGSVEVLANIDDEFCKVLSNISSIIEAELESMQTQLAIIEESKQEFLSAEEAKKIYIKSDQNFVDESQLDQLEQKYMSGNKKEPIWLIQEIKPLEQQTERIFNSLEEKPEQHYSTEDLSKYFLNQTKQILTKDALAKVEEAYKLFCNGKPNIIVKLRHQSIKLFRLIVRFYDYNHAVIQLRKNNFQGVDELCDTFQLTRHKPRKIVDHFTLKRVTTEYKAGDVTICELCANDQTDEEIPLIDLCENCNVKNCYTINKGGKTYLVDLSDASNVISKRVIKSENPKFEQICLLQMLEPQPENFSQVELDKGSLEYDFIQECFTYCEITRVTKFHCEKTRKKFCNKLEILGFERPLWETIKLLFFGSQEKAPVDIVKNGLNLPHRREGPYGNAFYFQQESSEADEFAYEQGDERSIIFGFVSVGESKKCEPQILDQPPDKSDGEPYDSVCSPDGNTYTIYNDGSFYFYPCYLVHYN